jgi:hypothetical protein
VSEQGAEKSAKAVTSDSMASQKGAANDDRAAARQTADSSSRPRISGVSGEFPAVTMRPRQAGRPARTKVAQYSRYNRRYTTAARARATARTFEPLTVHVTIDQPAYRWLPFAVYGGACCGLSVVWYVMALVAGTPILHGGALATLGLVLLCLEVCAGLVLVPLVTRVTLDHEQGLMAADVVAVSLGKTALMMVLAIIVWVVVTALAMM